MTEPKQAAQADEARTAAAFLTDAMRRDFVVVVPAYNEAPAVRDLVRELRAAFETFDLHGQVILVDDGSTDGTAEIARREAVGW
ncbi:MAG TPA: glycosyltransferase, partial [Gemmatimonadales bacterium]|nr:glycosyltransferase [Gemmatimonadales bacterium]